MAVNNQQLKFWSQPPSETEEIKCRNVVDSVKKAIENHFGSDVSIFLQGSYRNRTNVKKDSDVDIVLLHKKTYFPDLKTLTDTQKSLFWTLHKPSVYNYSTYRNDVLGILQKKFDANCIKDNNKCIEIEANTYRVKADVIPCFEHKRVLSPSEIDHTSIGIGFHSKKSGYIESYPKQHCENGEKKNQETYARYKDTVRILKNIRNELIDSGQLENDIMPSFFLESLIWNVFPHTHFYHSELSGSVNQVLEKVYQDMRDINISCLYKEVNDIKWLFPAGENKRTPEQAIIFLQKAYSLIN